MVSRSLTEVFVLMRNNAMHTRQMLGEQYDSEKAHLMSRSADAESGLAGEAPPPPWRDVLEEAHYVLSRLKTKIAELQACHERQIRRPLLDDSSQQEAISRVAAEVAAHFTSAHRHCTAIRAYARQGTKTEQKLVNNVVLALVSSLQELSLTFRSAQAHYLKTLTSREERSNAFFELPNFEELSLDDHSELLPGLTANQTDMLFALPSTSTNQNGYLEDENLDQMFERQAVSQKQLLLRQEENTKMVAEREAEVNKIVHSIMDLNDIFKDLAHMVHDQGTVLDRIDYNIEQTQVQVHEGYKQLQKAERYQRKNRKMHCILVLGVMIIILAVLLIIVKS
ncbi:syntaxin-16 [Plutella xylostella]|uniref:syntaxin-16 n=1 Tax=Plutella xylostella TaxID=51655 RepID=UPI00203286FB|nr:syntaxin-16 [Plutella xylostella]